LKLEIVRFLKGGKTENFLQSSILRLEGNASRQSCPGGGSGSRGRKGEEAERGWRGPGVLRGDEGGVRGTEKKKSRNSARGGR